MSELAEGARLEIVCAVKSGTEGSNPSLSATITILITKLSSSRFGVQARPGLRLVAARSYASESATGCDFEIVFTFYGIGFPSPHLDMLGLGQGFKGYNRWIMLPILISAHPQIR